VNCRTATSYLRGRLRLETPTLQALLAINKKVTEMANPTMATRLFWRARTRPVSAQPDFADLGTAFGLDLSMQSAAETGVEAPPVAARDSGWWRRLAASRSTTR